MAQQTAVEWLITELNQELNYIPITQWDRIRDLVQRAKQMEKEQLKMADSNGEKRALYNNDLEYGGAEYWDDNDLPQPFEKYYKKTYEK